MRRLELVPTVPKFFPETERALMRPLISHRGSEFEHLFKETIGHLEQLSLGNFTAYMGAGTGTWANELMAWNFANCPGSVLVCSNGEFGQRLFDQCRAANPDAELLDFGWNSSYCRKTIAGKLKGGNFKWIFGVACESSCGKENDLKMLQSLAEEYDLHIGLDAVSSAGTNPDLFRYDRIAVLSCSSGKALAGLPGISLLFVRKNFKAAPGKQAIPESLRLDKLLEAASAGGVRNTLCSMQLYALNASLGKLLELGIDDYRERLFHMKNEIVKKLKSCRIDIVEGSNSPMITAFHCPEEEGDWQAFLAVIRRLGYDIYYRAPYLREHKIFEIALMGNYNMEDIYPLLSLEI